MLRHDGSVILLSGDAGTGKTRLLREWVAVAQRRGCSTFLTTSHASEQRAFGCIAEICRACAAHQPRARPRVDPARRLFTRFLNFDEAAVEPDDEPWIKRQLFVIIREFFERCSTIAPIVLGFDDAQWMDSESLEFVRYLAANVNRSRLALVLSARSALSAADPYRSYLPSLQALVNAYRCQLIGLGETEARELIFHLVPAGERLSHKTVDEIIRRSGGNALFIEHLVSAARRASREFPLTVEASVEAQLRTLPASTVTYLQTAAALSTSIDSVFLRSLLSLTALEESAALEAAHSCDLLDGDAPDAVERFRHELIREAIYRRLRPNERRVLHERIAEQLERQRPDASPSMLANHWKAAGRAELMLPHAERAGDIAYSQYGFATARDCFMLALTATSVSPQQAARINEKLGEAFDKLGSAQESYDCFVQSVQHAKSRADRHAIARLSMRLANAAYRMSDESSALGHCADVIEGTAENDRERFAAYVLLATLHACRAAVEEAHRYLRLADRFAGERDPVDVIRRDFAEATLENSNGNLKRSVDASISAVNGAERYGDPVILANCLMNASVLIRTTGDYQNAERVSARATAISDANALSYSAAYSRLNSADLFFSIGSLARAHETLRAACALPVESLLERALACGYGLPIAMAVDDVQLVERLGDTRDVGTILEKAPAHFAALVASAHVELAAARRMGEFASEMVTKALSRLETPVYAEQALLRFARFSPAAQLADVFRLARRAREREDPDAQASLLLVGACEAARAQELGFRDELAARALEIANRFCLKMIAAAAHEIRGETAAAIAIYGSAGCVRDVRRLSGILTVRTTEASANLTKREREIARFVADGQSNRRIAASLSLSERTVEHHIASVFSKLNLHSRTELTALILRGNATG